MLLMSVFPLDHSDGFTIASDSKLASWVITFLAGNKRETLNLGMLIIPKYINWVCMIPSSSLKWLWNMSPTSECVLREELINFQHLERSRDFVWPQRNLTDAFRYLMLLFLGFMFVGLWNPYLFSSKLIMFPGGDTTQMSTYPIKRTQRKNWTKIQLSETMSLYWGYK